jgi:uncharacterized protein (DUF885 family)
MLLFVSCRGPQAPPTGDNTKTATEANPAFAAYEAYFLNAFWQQQPEWATQIGFHKFDTLLVIPGDASRKKMLDFVRRQTDSLQVFKTQQLNPAQQIDFRLIENQLAATAWAINDEKAFEWNPSNYNVTGLIAFMLTEQYAPLPERLKACYKRMAAIPAFYEAAKRQLKNPVKELTQLAIDQNQGGLSILEQDFLDSVKVAPLTDSEKTLLINTSQSAAKAIKSYISFLKTMNNPHPRSFRLGKDLYEKKFALDIQSGYTAEQLYDSAVSRKSELHEQMAQLGKKLWPKYFGNKPMPADSLTLIRKVIDTISMDHVAPADFQAAIEKILPKLTAFIENKKLLYLDPSKPLVVRKEPAYMAGVAGASISAPGPYDKNGNTYYNVGSLAGWPKEKAESYLREYNNYTLQILDIHEAIPGHYTQLVYANRSPSLIKSVFGNGAMIEGWAVYGEQMMMENGYGDNTPEMWMMWYKWHLRTVCNTILDYSVHVKNWDQKEAMDLLVRQAFQQKAEAEGKWKRVSVSSVQLDSYFAGYKAIYELREALKKKEGRHFSLRSFHETFLSFGSIPVKYIRERMLHPES